MRRIVLLACGLFLACVTIAVAQEGGVSGSGRALDPKNIDAQLKPCDDFYTFANGGWLSHNPVPADYSRWGSFEELQERNNANLHMILEAAAAQTAAKGSDLQLVGDFYASGMDSAEIEAAGTKPLEAEFARIAALNSLSEVPPTLAYFHVRGVNPLFVFFANQDSKNSTQVIAQLRQGGLGLPDRDYYIKDDDRSKKIRDEYVAHVTKMFELLGDEGATAAAEAKMVFDMESQLARASMTRTQQRDPNAIYHKMTLANLSEGTPAFSWKSYFNGIGLADPGAINVWQPEFFKEVNLVMGSRPLADWKTYLRWHLIHEVAAYLSSPFVNENFRFYGTVLTGAEVNKPRWKRVLTTVDGEVGEALGKLYVKKYFPPIAKARALEMVENLRAAFADRINSRPWMSSETKFRAIAKLGAFAVKIGYPDKWRSYAGLEIDRKSYVSNILRAEEVEFRRVLNKIGNPVDRTEWGLTPPTVNAYYNPFMNEIVFPAGILQPPFFDPMADDGVNYGGMGAVIGHEMTHGFDDQGSQFDQNGNLKDWWRPEDKISFAARTGLIEKQFDGYVAVDTLHINGKLTEGENIADLGGLTIAFYALRKAEGQLAADPKIDGFTPEQRFFLAWAQIWRANYRPEELRRRVILDPHSPSQFRTNGPLSDMPEFFTTFSCGGGTAMLRPQKDRPVIW